MTINVCDAGNSENMVYKAFGLNVLSSLSLPELPRAAGTDSNVDVVIEVSDLSDLWSQLVPAQNKSIIKKDLYMFRIPEVARFCIQDGKRITVSPEKGSDNDYIRLFILGTCMGALLMQRKILPLHGSVVTIDGKAFGFVGDSGAGKSTLASAFISKGYQLLSDDVIAVSLDRDNTPMVTPSYPQQKLWQETLNQFGMLTNGMRPIFKRENKFSVSVKTTFYGEPLPLAAIFELTKKESDKIEIHRVPGLERLQTLLLHTYRNYLIPNSELLTWHFNTSVNIASQIDFFRLLRPANGFTAHQLASLILNTLYGEV